jgi:hypothetical protein
LHLVGSFYEIIGRLTYSEREIERERGEKKREIE